MEPVQRIPRYTLLWQSELLPPYESDDRYGQVHIASVLTARETARCNRDRFKDS